MQDTTSHTFWRLLDGAHMKELRTMLDNVSYRLRCLLGCARSRAAPAALERGGLPVTPTITGGEHKCP